MPENTIKPYRSFRSRKTGGNADVYIVPMDQAAEVEKIKQDTDALILDCRKDADPNMQIRQSYKIMAPQDQTTILQIMLDYNAEFPTDPAWNRTFRSLRMEWALHNIAYLMGVQPKRTGDVDFNNGDEGKTLRDFLKNM